MNCDIDCIDFVGENFDDGCKSLHYCFADVGDVDVDVVVVVDDGDDVDFDDDCDYDESWALYIVVDLNDSMMKTWLKNSNFVCMCVYVCVCVCVCVCLVTRKRTKNQNLNPCFYPSEVLFQKLRALKIEKFPVIRVQQIGKKKSEIALTIYFHNSHKYFNAELKFQELGFGVPKMSSSCPNADNNAASMDIRKEI
ncbi:hypothetical protein BpHYR1_000629 [Brachionus plicatilis]|uniref:Uncharacterized protein n=1 Tax=Brachionus plicatilis TaxID=10195 RepID=A0A3M7RRL9_BRAPC|nr:hypothetical protein BpHYR1_000629 [Brachionus plicatilis]